MIKRFVCRQSSSELMRAILHLWVLIQKTMWMQRHLPNLEGCLTRRIPSQSRSHRRQSTTPVMSTSLQERGHGGHTGAPHDRLPMLGPMKTPWLLTENEFDSLFWCPLACSFWCGEPSSSTSRSTWIGGGLGTALSNGTEPLAC